MKILQGTADDIPLENGTVDCVVTSPPYWGRRRYGDDPAELGHEDLLDYVRRLTLVMRECRRVMTPRALAWVNIGDTSAGSGGAGGDHSTGSKQHMPKYRQGRPVSVFPYREDLLDRWTVDGGKLAGGNWALVPFLLAWHLQGDGWLVRKVIVWDKGQRRPEDLNHVRRPGESHEYVLMLAPRPDYRFWPDRLEETGDVWHFAPGGQGPAHFAPFPDELARRCILPSTEAGDVVFDPFSGSNTVPRVAEELGRQGVGLELYPQPGDDAVDAG